VAVERSIEPVAFRDKSSRRGAVRFEGNARVSIRVEEELLEFETLNYSQYGMFIRHAESARIGLFQPGQIVHGMIGSGTSGRVAFQAQVVRVTRQPREGYALRVISRLVIE
jgi:hypothetical protein